METEPGEPLKVLIVGGGVAGLEACLALREFAGDRINTTLLSPQSEFVYRPLRVREPFAGPRTKHYALDEITRDIGVELKRDGLKWLDPVQRVVHTEAGEQLRCDALLLALGARLRPRFSHALTLDDRKLDEQLQGLIQDVEAGRVHSLAFIAPSPMPWPLPMYELALMTAQRAYEMNETVSITIVTPEDAPLAFFGGAASQAVRKELETAGIAIITSTHAETPSPSQVTLHPSGGSLSVDRIVALPELFGPSTPGVPKHDGHGFISVDAHCRVRGLDQVFAAGDATDFVVKLGSIAAHQADVAAANIARLAGVEIAPLRFNPEIHAMLLGGARPLYLSAQATGTHGSNSVVSEEPDWYPGTKIAAKYLAPYLESRVEAEHHEHGVSDDGEGPTALTRPHVGTQGIGYAAWPHAAPGLRRALNQPESAYARELFQELFGELSAIGLDSAAPPRRLAWTEEAAAAAEWFDRTALQTGTRAADRSQRQPLGLGRHAGSGRGHHR